MESVLGKRLCSAHTHRTCSRRSCCWRSPAPTGSDRPRIRGRRRRHRGRGSRRAPWRAAAAAAGPARGRAPRRRPRRAGWSPAAAAGGAPAATGSSAASPRAASAGAAAPSAAAPQTLRAETDMISTHEQTRTPVGGDTRRTEPVSSAIWRDERRVNRSERNVSTLCSCLWKTVNCQCFSVITKRICFYLGAFWAEIHEK